jgi:glycosyltransferase 2 family protein
MLRKSRRYLLLLLVILALGYCFYRFRDAVSLQGFRWHMVGAAIREARISLLLLSLAAIYACYAIRALRWVRFCRWLGAIQFWDVFSSTLMGFACTFLLGRVGEPVRPILIARKGALPMPGMFGVYVLERVFDMAATALLAILALLSFERRGPGGAGNDLLLKIARSAGVLLLIGLVGAIAFLIYFRHHGAGWLAEKLKHPNWRKGWREKLAVLLEGFSDGLRGVRTWADFGVLTGYTAVHWMLVALVYFWTARAFGGELAGLSLPGATLVLAFTLVGSAAQLPGIGGGSQAATFLVLTLIFGVQPELAAVVAIVIWLVTFAGCCLAGVPLLLREGWSMGELRRMARTEAKAEEEALLAEAEQGGGLPDGSRARPQ